jgi:hypothetical protein
VRARIDAAVAKALGIPTEGLEALRQMFSAEPRLQPEEKRDSEKRPTEPDDGQELLPLFN